MIFIFVLFLPLIHSISITKKTPGPLTPDFQTHNFFLQYDPNITIDLSSSTLSGCNSSIQVSISGVTAPNANDYLGLFLSDDDILQKSPIKFKLLATDPTYLSNGNTSFNVVLLNLRSPLVWYFFQRVNDSSVLLQVSKNITFTNYNEPCFGRLGLTKNPQEMRVTWNTRDSNSPSVKYGLASGNYTWESSASSSTYTSTMLCGPPANSTGYRSPGQIHTAILTNLQPSTRYYYQYGDTYGRSAEYSFIASPKLNPDSAFRFILVGDMGASDDDGSTIGAGSETPAPKVAQAISSENASLVILIGDISYANGYLSSWDSFHHQIQSFVTHIPLVISQGNHDRDFPGTDTTYNSSDSGGECGIPIETLYPMPYFSKSQPWFSFNYGSIHFLLMNTEVDFTTTSSQHDWIDQDLAAVNLTLTPNVVFTGHRPMYCDSSDYSVQNRGAGNVAVQEQLRTHVEPLLHKHNVSIAFWGHSHTYQRTCPIINQHCSANGTTHVVVGTGGRHFDTASLIPSTPPSWLRYLSTTTHGYIRGDVNDKNIRLEYVSVNGVNGNTQELDSFTANDKNEGWKSCPSSALSSFLIVIFIYICIKE